MVEERRTGKTTQQMLDAPKKAYYIWPNKALGYPRALAQSLGRKDITVCTVDFFGPRSGKGRGLRVDIVVDHACVLTVSSAVWIDQHNKSGHGAV